MAGIAAARPAAVLMRASEMPGATAAIEVDPVTPIARNDCMHLIPGLAERWESSPDGLEYTLTLRSDAVWEDGRPITARDAAFTIARIVDPKVPSTVYKPLFEELDSVKVVDARTLRVRFRSTYAFREMAFVIPVLPERRFAGQDFLRAKENRAPLASGPYRVASWTPQAIALERNPRFPGPPGHFDRILFRVIPDDTTAYRLLTAGELDEDQLNPTLKDRAIRDAEFHDCCRLVEFYSLDYSYVALNNRSPFFADPRVRRALTMARFRPRRRTRTCATSRRPGSPTPRPRPETGASTS